MKSSAESDCQPLFGGQGWLPILATRTHGPTCQIREAMMPATQTSATATISWEPLSNSQRVVFIGRVDSKPVAIIEMLPTRGFRSTTCGDVQLGDFPNLAAAIEACAAHLELAAV